LLVVLLFIGVIIREYYLAYQETAILLGCPFPFSLFRDVFDLTGDFFLDRWWDCLFSGLYSRYILSIFDYYLAYSHNLYLDLIIEQGILVYWHS
jgi:hypothetical protein